jgi:hypothetical protein
MSKSLRFSEKWFRRGLWVVALVFANFLIGLGGLVVGDLPRVEPSNRVEDFIDAPKADAARAALRAQAAQLQASADARERAALVYQAAQNQAQNARDTFANWLATRAVTGSTQTAQPEQDAELVRRTQALDALKAAERRAQATLEKIDRDALVVQQAQQQKQAELNRIEFEANEAWSAAQQSVELRIFLIRLAVTLPLLAVAGWLFVRHRHGNYWPFVWGFIFFALFAFFVELVPYLPSYGGYVRYLVGILLTLGIGRYAIVALQRYLDRQKAAEALSESERRADISYEVAHERLNKGICPGCERPVDLKDGARNFCMHCGIGLFRPCPACAVRINAFARYCHACGAAPAAQTRPQ